MRIGILFMIVFCVSPASYAQVYKKWFLNQSDIRCKAISVGYAIHSYFQDTTAIKLAFRNACINFVRNKQDRISGGEAFWATGIGTFDMGNNFTETYDTTMVPYYEKQFFIIDTLAEKNFVAVLTSFKGCKLRPGELKGRFINISNQPDWVEAPPRDKNYYYSVGMSPGYFYEKSSWLEAEKSARLALASSISTYVESLQLMDFYSSQDIENRALSVTLNNVQIVSRWRDINNNIFYVLMKMPK